MQSELALINNFEFHKKGGFNGAPVLAIHPTMLSPECVSYHRDRKFCCYLAGLPVLVLDIYLLILYNTTPSPVYSRVVLRLDNYDSLSIFRIVNTVMKP